MKRGPDDDALSWGDESDPTYVAPDLADDDPADDDLTEVDRADVGHDSAEPADDATGAGEQPIEDATSVGVEPVKQDAAGSPRWASGAAPTAEVVEANRVAVSDAKVRQADAAEDAAVEDELADAEEASAQLSSAALITFGVVGGVFFLYTIGWLVAFIRNPLHPGGFAEVWQDVQGVAAIAAPALWFLVTLLLAARRRVAVRLIWLLVGIVVVVPWPFILGV
ncbi:hypothetical protein [Subtercola lobariae]|uniref:DNA polymerase III subunit gamma/tau n=1 Tax=Subtercola lobariae TaxID=1588641 RepID=A0A917B2U6_9MICO|nr:hypothetical protein [Subtercola lobariae]GGF14574.1 hypothetical protein GCM10011399_05530 [Subtercola lobariae]